MAISTSITAICTAISEACRSFTQCKRVQSESNIIKELKRKSEAIDYAEKIIALIDQSSESIKEDKAYRRYRRAFFKFN